MEIYNKVTHDKDQNFLELFNVYHRARVRSDQLAAEG
jgi:hypothetical protein